MSVALNYREQGSGPPLIILHGLFGSAANWGRIARDLATDHRVIVADLRNHGASPHADDAGYPAMAEDIAELVGCVSPDEPPTLLGHSMGGKTAMRFALEHPGRVARLIVVDIAPRAYRGHQDGVFDALCALDLDGLGSRAEADARLADRLPDPGLRAFLLANLQQADGRLRWRVNLPVLAARLADIEGFPVPDGARYDGPVQFIAGRDSDYLKSGDEETIRELFPRAGITWIEGAGHWVHAAQPAAFLEAVRDFLAR
ncbi:MAG: alpha/beta fold hydrolase [Gammaproteobacteria bacterium]|nr:alpha/beta fold hydrolase [Gammaproteobacteria bacterium]